MYSLWNHQAQSAELLQSGSAILWHEMRLGKTRSALHAYNQLVEEDEVADLVVVTVAMAKATWRQEIEQMGLGIPSFTGSGQKRLQLQPNLLVMPQAMPRIFILNWEILPQWQRWIQQQTYKRGRKFILVLDEGHLYLRNPQNQRYKAAMWLSKFAYATWELTGTLLVKGGLDIYYQARLLGKDNPFVWMDEEDFGSEYCNRRFNPFKGGPKGKGGWEYTTLKYPDDVMEQLASVSVLRIRDVVDIPQALQMPRWVDDLDQAWDHYRDDKTLAEEIGALVPIKARLTAEYVQQLEPRPVVVFGWHIGFTERVADLLEAPLIHGGTSPSERERLRSEFQAGKHPVLVGNLRSLGLGISLDRADHFVYGEPYWDASLYLQAQARGVNLHKDRPIAHHHLLVAGSVDEYVWKVRLNRGQAIEDLYQAASERERPNQELARE